MARKLSVAAATLTAFALVAGRAFAAGHYLITSKSQIKPSVLQQLKGNRGARGSRGPAGAAGLASVDVVQSALTNVCMAGGSCPQSAQAIAYCPSGDVPVSGGFAENISSTSDAFDNTVLSSAIVKNSTGVGWGVVLANLDPKTAEGGFYAIADCAPGGLTGSRRTARPAPTAASRLAPLATSAERARVN